MFINKLIYKTSNFKEKKDRFFTVFVSFKITSRHTNTMIEYKFWIPYQIVEKVTTFSNRKKTSHQTFCFFYSFYVPQTIYACLYNANVLSIG